MLSSIDVLVPVAAITGLLFFMAWCVGLRNPFYRTTLDVEVASRRFHSLDGLRGLLALGVMFHHLIVNYHFYHSGLWELTPPRVSIFFGRGGVAFFFMITAFLFWGRALDGKLLEHAGRFYVSRLRRTVPMYLVSVLLVIITAFGLTHFRLNQSIPESLKQVWSWLLFTIPGVPAINAYAQTSLINTVFWSLVYEWKFYFVLPFLAVFASSRAMWILLIGVSATIACFSTFGIEWFFVGGALAAVVVKRLDAVRRLAAGPLGIVLIVASIATLFIVEPTVYTFTGAVLLFFPFLAIASGNTLLGLMTCRPARLLGLLSYSIYLLHNWVLFLVYRLVNHWVNVDSLSMAKYWVVGGMAALFTALLATITYRFVEAPFLRQTRVDVRDTKVACSMKAR
ncbi:acyltransferase [Paraburkholderia bryophila]|uniref:acyltransferase family protein n=1 Tax=Paraburkholderia bryophila TaxID=420952 RepID=UPI00234BDDB5|nr:acyltransferase [Paraburkholderia bryophila]WCM20557.1 acyltransferase [Paraburkholderia bryophila]